MIWINRIMSYRKDIIFFWIYIQWCGGRIIEKIASAHFSPSPSMVMHSIIAYFSYYINSNFVWMDTWILESRFLKPKPLYIVLCFTQNEHSYVETCVVLSCLQNHPFTLFSKFCIYVWSDREFTSPLYKIPYLELWLSEEN